jgi:hypothetical protein
MVVPKQRSASLPVSLLRGALRPWRCEGPNRTSNWLVTARGDLWPAFVLSVVLRGTLVQTYTPPEMMGRVQAVNGFFISSSNELGAFESGLAARLMGIVPSVVSGGA